MPVIVAATLASGDGFSTVNGLCFTDVASSDGRRRPRGPPRGSGRRRADRGLCRGVEEGGVPGFAAQVSAVPHVFDGLKTR